MNHLALVCADMQRTVDFYSGVLGMPLVKTIELPFDQGQHFFFDMGGGNLLAFFWFPQAPPPAPGIAAPTSLPGRGPLESAIGSMNHIAFTVPADKIDEYRQQLRDKGIRCSPIMNHDDSELGVSEDVHEGVFLRSTYFFDPDGILLEFAAWTAPLGPDAVKHEPARAVKFAARELAAERRTHAEQTS